MNNFNFQSLIQNIRENRAFSFRSMKSYPSYTPAKTEVTKTKFDDLLTRFKKPVLETPKIKKLFTETPDTEPKLQQPTEEPVFEPEMYANYGIVCPKDESLEEKWFDKPMANYGIVCFDDIEKPEEKSEEPKTKDVKLRLEDAETLMNYGIVCPKDETLKIKTMMLANYGIVCPFDADNTNS